MRPDEMDKVSEEFGVKKAVKPRGRPVANDEVWMHVRVPKDVRIWISRMAEANERSDSYVARALLLDGVAADTNRPNTGIISHMVPVPYISPEDVNQRC